MSARWGVRRPRDNMRRANGTSGGERREGGKARRGESAIKSPFVCNWSCDRDILRGKVAFFDPVATMMELCFFGTRKWNPQLKQLTGVNNWISAVKKKKERSLSFVFLLFPAKSPFFTSLGEDLTWRFSQRLWNKCHKKNTNCQPFCQDYGHVRPTSLLTELFGAFFLP